jgi:NADH-quinone oxidoreductase subunit L
MALYDYSWLILLSPLFSFAAIIFGTRVWDLLSRPPTAVAVAGVQGAQGSHGASSGDAHGSHGQGDAHDEHGDDDNHRLDDDDNPKVARLTTGAKASAYVGIAITLFACIYAWVMLLNSAGVLPIAPALKSSGETVFSYVWLCMDRACQGIGGLTFGPSAVTSAFPNSYLVSFHIDNLAIAMMVVVTTISLLVQFYSQGYMENSAGYARFYSYLSLFTFSMLVIVFAENFLVMFVGWELVGLSSYLLIGFWINKRAKPAEDRLSPATAGMEAFITNRVGDVGFMIGIMILFANTHTFQFAQLYTSVAHMDKGYLAVAMILIFCGAIGKSAQVPLHVWLPPAMEGPTPVSALIHAATMVAAGVYMVARTLPLFQAADPVALQTVAWVGGITAIFAATIALTQTDFKRVLAFSTISQLGYMFVGLGVAGTDLGAGPGMFHLFTHAFFKALLFLGAGSVIEALHHATHKEVQDMRLMGGLAKYMPITAATWLIATLSISGFPFFAGFYSKDSIISLCFEHGYYALWAITLLTAGLTAFYMLRAFILAFGGKGGSYGGLWGGPYRGEGTPHESPLTMTIPLMLLAIPSIVAGYWFGFSTFLGSKAPGLDFGTIISDWKTWLGVGVALVGFAWAYTLYAVVGMEAVSNYVQKNAVLRVLHRILLRKYYIDQLYDALIRYGVFGISHIEQAFDTYIVDGLVNGTARLVTSLGRGVRHVETGKVQGYMVGFFGGIAVLATVVIVLVIFIK